MSRLIRLYPQARRERFQDEILEMLAARPATVRDRFDILRGVPNAWVLPLDGWSSRSSCPGNDPTRPLRRPSSRPSGSTDATLVRTS